MAHLDVTKIGQKMAEYITCFFPLVANLHEYILLFI